ncbi:SusD/RagB family nutrient-binding outer membrane lipoprotein [Flavobacterium psychrotrophum]|uniref:SusD/RagB family nutrient-binding outer membrane lipoprotein n=1 Tax=Flavobacterium psychrotrophum TaxID=2294119 RepID=UPI000E32279C|nr:SusD/RagB family nutrient-binding outer membrane lipoprotein [Flavobacterium psychrotrophum]
MKNIHKLVIVMLVGLFVSCDKDLDINTDPNYPGEINAGLALTSAQANIATVVGGELTSLGGFLAQYHTQAPSASQFENIDSYNLNTGYANTPWTQLYAGALTDLQYVSAESEEAGDTATLLIAEALRAYTYQLLVDLFNDVPYSEALQGTSGNITPKVDTGAEIYTDLIVKLNAAVAAYDANPTTAAFPSQDVIYGGDINLWKQFINTLKLKIYLRMAYTPQANPAAVNALMAEDNFLTQEAAFATFVNVVNKTNPFYGTFLSTGGSGLGDGNHIASNALHDFYDANDDPRLKVVYRRSPLNGEYTSIAQGSGNTFNNTAQAYARPNIRPKTPVFLMSTVESNFMQAEALIRYAGGAGAKEKYDAGVLSSLTIYQSRFFININTDFTKDDPTRESDSPWTVAQTGVLANDLTGTGGVYEYVPNGNVETALRQVIVQKWASLPYINNIEAWIESTRTKFPEVVSTGTQDYSIGNRIPSLISVLSGTNQPSILFYPDDEANRNPNITQHANLLENVWWDQKPE